MSSTRSLFSASRDSLVKRLGRPCFYWKKHPVTRLYDYGKFYGIRPKFTFVEIPQHSGIEYACIAEMDQFFGEGKSFNKKTSKAIAATELLQKIKYGDQASLGQKKKPARYVSQTFHVSVVPDLKGPEVWSCSSDSGVCSLRGSAISPTDEVSVPGIYNTQNVTTKYDRLSPSSQASDTEEESIDDEPHDAEFEKEMDVEEPDCHENDHMIDEIKSFIEESPTVPQVQSQKELDEKQKLLDPRQYLEECCVKRKLKPPAYVASLKDGHFEAHCTLMAHITYGKGDRLSDAKQLAATQMIEVFKW